MNNNSRRVGLVCFTFIGLFFSCSDMNGKKMDNLYSVNTMLDEQANYLTRKAAKLTKVSRLGDKSDTVAIVPKDNEMWKGELEIFSAIDVVNKPANRKLYTVETHPDVKSNLSVKTFATSENLPVIYLKFFYQETEDKIRKIEAKYIEANILYKSTRLLSMEFQPVGDTIILTSYEIHGAQKMFLSDSVQYTILGAVTLPN